MAEVVLDDILNETKPEPTEAGLSSEVISIFSSGYYSINKSQIMTRYSDHYILKDEGICGRERE